MRVIMFIDADGHGQVVEATVPNVRAMCDALRAVDPHSLQKTDEVLKQESPTLEDIETALCYDYQTERTSPHRIYFRDVKTTWDFPYSPFE